MRAALTQFIAAHLHEVSLSAHSLLLPPGTRCAFSGEEITVGVPLKTVIKPATANIADTFRHPSEYVSVACATCFAAARELRGNLFIDAQGITKPLISAKTAAKTGRPTWSRCMREYLENPRNAALIMTDESKRRLWIDACITSGTPLQVFVNSADFCCKLCIAADTFLKCLDLVETCLAHGFSKVSIKTTLFRNRDIANKIGFLATRQLESQLQPMRQKPEFSVANFIGSYHAKN